MNHESPGAPDNVAHLHAISDNTELPTQLESRMARLEFAEALGRQTVQDQPELFTKLLVGRWSSLEHFVDDFITESGLADSVADLPSVFHGLVSVNRLRVTEYLRSYLMVLPVGEGVWVFDARRKADDER